MSKLINIVGHFFGELTILDYLGTDGKSSNWLARCSCGNEIQITRRKLKKGKKSCGCLVQKSKFENILDRVSTANKTKKKYVYVMSYTEGNKSGLIKIGSTSNVDRRLKELDREYYGIFNLLYVAETALPSDLERALHLIFKSEMVVVNRVDGIKSREFFDIDILSPVKYFYQVGAEVSYD